MLKIKILWPCLCGEQLAQGPEVVPPAPSPPEPTGASHVFLMSSSTVYTRNCKPGSGGRVNLG